MRLAYADCGPGPAVVLLHGFPLSRVMWQEQLSGVGSAYRVIAPDLRGHGESPAPEGVYTMDEMADDVVELIDFLHIGERIVLGGLSMGGYVALSLVARYPQRIRALMLMDTRAGADSPEVAKNREASARAVLDADKASPVVDAMLPKLFCKQTLEERPERVEPLRTLMEQTRRAGSRGPYAAWRSVPTAAATSRSIAVPTLVVVGQDDVITPPAEAKALADAIPQARLEVIPTAGHLAPYENPSVANHVILRFLNSLQDED